MTDIPMYDAKRISEDEIVLKSDKDMLSVSKDILDGKEFGLKWVEGGMTKSKLIFGEKLSTNLKSGTLVLMAEENTA